MDQAEPCLEADEQAAIRRAARALVRSANRQGLWEAFQLRPGGSSIWTSAVVLHALGAVFRACPDLLTVPLLQRSWGRAWSCFDCLDQSAVGFNRLTPADADSTIWLRRALTQRQWLAMPKSVAMEQWIRCLDVYIDAHSLGAGVCTYLHDDGILDFVGLPSQSSSSWLLPHGCVGLNRVALLAELGVYSAPQALDAVASTPLPFWWQEPQIGAWLIASATGFRDCGTSMGRLLVSLFDDSVTVDSPSAVVRVLLRAQLSSGLWPALFTLRVPGHSDRTGAASSYRDSLDTEGALCRDNGIFTTALVLAALAVNVRQRQALCV